MKRPARTLAALGLALPVIATAQATKPDQQDVSVARAGAGASSQGPADTFTGTVRIEGRFQREAPARVGGATVTFEPSARTAWHTHPLGQTLIVTKGHGFVQQWQRPAHAIGLGDVVWIPPGTRHWHGASANTAMTHVAISEVKDGRSVTWMEKVSDAQYAEATLQAGTSPSAETNQQR